MRDLQENRKKDNVGRGGHQDWDGHIHSGWTVPHSGDSCAEGSGDSRPTKFPQWKAPLERGSEGNTAGCVVRIQSPQPLKNAVHRTSVSLFPFLPLRKGLLIPRSHKAELRINEIVPLRALGKCWLLRYGAHFLPESSQMEAVFSRFPQLLLPVGFAITSREFLKRA